MRIHGQKVKLTLFHDGVIVKTDDVLMEEERKAIKESVKTLTNRNLVFFRFSTEQ